ncbi:DUF1801 domain-containing protein [Undibacterium seohonense]|jgi:hypothetical protein|nr:DUF1801 domain-containing protein [Undibacterium seohonense]
MSKNMSETKTRVELYLQDLSLTNAATHALVQALRKQILGLSQSSDESVQEEIKYGGILFAVEQAFCGVFAYANHVSLEFGEGASLPDRFGVLEGKGKFRRHIKLETIAEIESKHLMHYVKMAYQRSLTS